MPSAVGQTLKKMREQTELSVRALARELGMPPSTYSAYEDKFKRDELPIRLVRQLVPILPAEKVWALAGLDEGVGESLPSAASFNAGNMPVMARIEEFDVRAAAGAPTFMDNEADRPTVIHEWQMPRELIRSVTYAPVERVKIITVVGDSMEGTFRPFEKVMVDTQDCTPSPPGIFVVYDGLGTRRKEGRVRPALRPGRCPHHVGQSAIHPIRALACRSLHPGPRTGPLAVGLIARP